MRRLLDTVSNSARTHHTRRTHRMQRVLSWPRLAALAVVLCMGILPANAAFRAQTAPTTLSPTRPVAALLCRYADVETTFGFTADGIQQHMWAGPKSIDALVQEASLGTMNLNGSQTFGWFTLPGTMASYPADFVGAAQIARDCSAAAQAGGVDLSAFTYEMVYLNDRLGGMEGGSFTSAFNGRPPTIVNGVSLMNTAVLTYRALNSPGLVLHELGHILGGVHTFSAADPLGGGSIYGTNPKLPNPDGTLSKRNVGPIWDGYNRDRMGFVPADRKVTFPGGTQTVELSRLTQPIAGLPMLVDVPYGTGQSGDGANRYVVSARTRIGFDAARGSDDSFSLDPVLAVPGVMIQNVNGQQPTAVMLSRAGGDRNTSDGVFVAGQSFYDVDNGITITVDRFDDNGATLRIISGPVVTTTTSTTTTTTTTLAPTTTIALPAATVVGSDDYADAPQVGLGNVGPQSNANAALQTDEVRPCAQIDKTVWVKFVAPATGSFTASTAGSNFDTVIATWKSSERAPAPPPAWFSLGCNDDFQGTPQSSITFNANAGDVVYLQAGSSGFVKNLSGNLFINVRQN